MKHLHEFAFEYRNASTLDAQQSWEELEAYVKRLIEDEREAMIEIARTVGGKAGLEMENSIRARGQHGG